MKSQTQRGMALVITLIMLSVVTVMAIIFLGISRRERTSVGVAGSLQDARLAADAGLARAQAEILARIAASGNLLDYDLFVSTNYINYDGFDSSQPANITNKLNVNYYYRPHGSSANPVVGEDLLKNLRNLYYDPRPPVFVQNLNTGAKEFRYYLDLNRNGRFDTNGWVPVMDRGFNLGRTNWMWGDPEWVGILERPELPHSGTNRFTMRYAYLALPAGKSLDINFIHNNVRRVGTTHYGRNQGVGSWELNLAAFFRKWMPEVYAPTYAYSTLGGANTGLAFDHATLIHRFRMQADAQTNAARVLGAAGLARLLANGVDDFSDDTPALGTSPNLDDDLGAKPWPAFDYRAAQFRNQEFFDTNGTRRPLLPIATNLLISGRKAFDTTNQYAFMRLLSQMGTDSLPANRGRVHLNYTNGYWSDRRLVNGRWVIPNDGPVIASAANLPRNGPVFVEGAETNMVPWADSPTNRTHFMMMATHRILMTEMTDAFPFGLAGGIQIYPTNQYIGAVHRCAQLAANMLDTSTRDVPLGFVATNRVELPSVFRPIFQKANDHGRTVLLLVGFEEASDASVLGRLTWVDLSKLDPEDGVKNIPVTETTTFYGVPWVIGAKKGWPNFNEFYSESTVSVNRRLQARKTGTRVQFEQSYELGVTNLIGVEAWNSYLADSPVPMRLAYTNVTDVWLRDTRIRRFEESASVVRATNGLLATSLVLSNWAGRATTSPAQFIVFTNSFSLVPKSSYLASEDNPTNAVRFSNGTVFGQFPRRGGPVPDWKLNITNHVFFVLTATNAVTRQPQIVDLVSFSPVVSGFDITHHMQGTENPVAGAAQIEDSFWFTNQTVLRNPKDNAVLEANASRGITNQIYVSLNDVLSDAAWKDLNRDNSGRTRQVAIDEFRMFLGLPPIFDTRRPDAEANPIQVPFTPGRRLTQSLSWMANDPLVHYHLMDLYDAKYSDISRVQVKRAGTDDTGYLPDMPNLGRQNAIYRPWPSDAAAADAPGDNYSPWLKDPWVRSSDDWEFPTNSYPNVGWLGRVHRGTPWQTVYLKAKAVTGDEWKTHMGKRTDSGWTHPTNDWRLADVFTATPNANASRGLLSVNQTNEAAWAAVLDGVRIQTNSFRRTFDPSVNPGASTNYAPLYIDSGTPQFNQLVRGINSARTNFFGRSYKYLGDILAAPALTDASPYLNLPAPGNNLSSTRITDAVYEQLPQQILGLLQQDQPYFVVYAYGQSLRPADRSLVLSPGRFFNMCTNYEITGEVLTKTAFRITEQKQGTNLFYDTVLEDFSVLPLD